MTSADDEVRPTSPDDAAPVPAQRVLPDPDLDPVEEPAPVDVSPRRHRVVAVLVAHDGAPWVVRALRAVLDQDRPVDALRVVDTGSVDDTPELVARVLAEHPAARDLDVRVDTVDRRTGFGAAVAHALREDAAATPADADPATGPEQWLWTLHDDCAPEPGALRALLTAVADRPSVAVAGPKVLGWADPRHLLEVGVTLARSGRRETGLERHEQDQGQHDSERGVLAVSTAGMLVRRRVWDALGGLDPALPLFRDDVDLGWRVNAAGHRVLVVPDAVVHHAEAATHRRRHLAATPDQPHRVDRQHALTVLLAHAATPLLPVVLVRLVLGSLVRALAFVVGKDLPLALAEVRAVGSVLRHPSRVREMRAARAATRVVPRRDLRRLLAPRGAQLRHAVDLLAGLLAGGDGRRAVDVGAARAPDDEDEELTDFLTGADSALRRLLRRPGVVLLLVLVGLTVLAARGLVGGGRLAGGVLLPEPGGASDLWSAYATSWGEVGLGSTLPAPPATAVLAALSTVTLGKVWLVLDVLVLLAVPLAAATSYLATRRVVRSTLLRLWASASYALLPVVTGAVAGGRVGTLVLLVLLPLAAPLALRLAGVLGPPSTWRLAWGAGLLLTLLTAFTPQAWLLAVVLAVVAAATTTRARTDRLRMLAAVLTPVLLLAPWSLRLLRHPTLLLVEHGVHTASAVDLEPSPALVLLLAPGGPGTAPAWVGLGLVAAALAALLRRRRRRVVRVAWSVAVVGLVMGTLAASVSVRTHVGAPALPAWPGPFLVVATAALLVAALVAAHRAREQLAATSFGSRQPVVVLVAVLCVLGPLVSAVGWLVRGAGDPLDRGAAQPLPAFVEADLRTPERPRAMVLRSTEAGRVSYTVVRDGGTRLGQTGVVDGRPTGLSRVVADLTAGRGGDPAGALAQHGIRYVVVERPVPQRVERALDATAGLRRVGTAEQAGSWRVDRLAGRVRLSLSGQGTRLLPSTDRLRVDLTLPEDTPAGRITLAELADRGWKARLGGRPLTGGATEQGLQTFELPAGGGRLEVTLDRPVRARWLVVQGVLLVVVVVLALPGRRREGEGEDA